MHRTMYSPRRYKDVSDEQLVKVEVMRLHQSEHRGYTEYREVLCPSSITSLLVTDLYQALSQRSYLPAVDKKNMPSKMTEEIKGALKVYQIANGLPIGSLNI